jgi:hypothetical protein
VPLLVSLVLLCLSWLLDAYGPDGPYCLNKPQGACTKLWRDALWTPPQGPSLGCISSLETSACRNRYEQRP